MKIAKTARKNTVVRVDSGPGKYGFQTQLYHYKLHHFRQTS